jgi:hypothetical protein
MFPGMELEFGGIPKKRKKKRKEKEINQFKFS